MKFIGGMMELNPEDHIRQLRFRDNLRWYLKNEALLRLRMQRGQRDAQSIIRVFKEVLVSFAEGKMDVFNEIVERYQVSGLKGAVYPDCSGLILNEIQDIVEVSEVYPSSTEMPLLASRTTPPHAELNRIQP
jgi:hypothetical protein